MNSRHDRAIVGTGPVGPHSSNACWPVILNNHPCTDEDTGGYPSAAPTGRTQQALPAASW